MPAIAHGGRGGGGTRRSHVSQERAEDGCPAATTAGRTARQAALVSSVSRSSSPGNLGGRPRDAHTSGEISFGLTTLYLPTKVGKSGIENIESALQTDVDGTSHELEESAQKHCVTMHLQAQERPPRGAVTRRRHVTPKPGCGSEASTAQAQSLGSRVPIFLFLLWLVARKHCQLLPGLQASRSLTFTPSPNPLPPIDDIRSTGG